MHLGTRSKSAIRTQPEQLRLLLGKTACGARASQKNRRGLRLQAQPGFAAPSCARRSPAKPPRPCRTRRRRPRSACMEQIKRASPLKRGSPFYLFGGGDGGNRTYRKLRFFTHLEGFAGKMQTINAQLQLSANSGRSQSDRIETCQKYCSSEQSPKSR